MPGSRVPAREIVRRYPRTIAPFETSVLIERIVDEKFIEIQVEHDEKYELLVGRNYDADALHGALQY